MLERSLALDPGSPIAYNNLGFAYGRAGQIERGAAVLCGVAMMAALRLADRGELREPVDADRQPDPVPAGGDEGVVHPPEDPSQHRQAAAAGAGGAGAGPDDVRVGQVGPWPGGDDRIHAGPVRTAQDRAEVARLLDPLADEQQRVVRSVTERELAYRPRGLPLLFLAAQVPTSVATAMGLNGPGEPQHLAVAAPRRDDPSLAGVPPAARRDVPRP